MKRSHRRQCISEQWGNNIATYQLTSQRTVWWQVVQASSIVVIDFGDIGAVRKQNLCDLHVFPLTSQNKRGITIRVFQFDICIATQQDVHHFNAAGHARLVDKDEEISELSFVLYGDWRSQK